MANQIDSKKTVFLIDGSTFLYRAYYGMRPLHTSKGLAVQAVYTFCRMIKSLINKFEPHHMALVWDSPGKTERHEVYQDYKAGRQAPPSDLFEQKEYIVKFANLIGLNQLQRPGVEADDIIASLAKDYKVPNEWNKNNLIGSLVHVPIRNTKTVAIVEKTIEHLEFTKFEIKEALSCEPFPKDNFYQKFIKELSNYYQIDSLHFLKRIRQFIFEKVKKTEEFQAQEIAIKIKQEINLTKEQQEIVNFLTSKIDSNEYAPTLLHGVTGSGKTEVYKKTIIHTIKQNKSALLLLPEVTLALQFQELLKKSLPNYITIFGFHSAISPKEKRALWKALLNEEPILIVGVHLPVLLPISNLGIIIVDEEHEVGFQEKKHPKINTKDAAILKACLKKIPILLGSATPSVSSLYNVKTKGWNFFQLKNRFSGNFPKIEIVNLTEKKFRKNFWISKELEKSIKENLEKKEQTIIFLNRRGYSFFVQCKECSFVFNCKSCSVSLTLHKNGWLNCHYCGFSLQYPNQCPSCKASEEKFIKKGIGTQQVVSILQDLFPDAKIERADLDTTSKKKSWNKTVKDFGEGKLDILVGTQTITKGYHFPKVTLVGILWADINLNIPMYNCAESTLSQLIQVAGRAGRQSANSKVIVQTMINHPIFEYLNEVDYLKFYESEIQKRELTGYPPYNRFIEIELKNTQENKVVEESEELTSELLDIAEKLNLNAVILGPACPPVEKIKDWHSRKIYIKCKNINDAIKLYSESQDPSFTSQVFFTPNPMN